MPKYADMTIRVDSIYDDGYEATAHYDVNGVAYETMPWVLWEQLEHYTGSGYGAVHDVGYLYRVTIIECTEPAFIGLSHEWEG
jgi:hypothetical protein